MIDRVSHAMGSDSPKAPARTHDRVFAPHRLRRTTEGKTKREIIRCLKRYIARETYRTLREDLAINT
jgi:hypothetical protein